MRRHQRPPLYTAPSFHSPSNQPAPGAISRGLAARTESQIMPPLLICRYAVSVGTRCAFQLTKTPLQGLMPAAVASGCDLRRLLGGRRGGERDTRPPIRCCFYCSRTTIVRASLINGCWGLFIDDVCKTKAH